MLSLLDRYTLSGRILAALAVLAGLVAAVWGYGYLERRAGREEGRAEVRAQWGAAKQRQRQVDAAARRSDAQAAAQAAASFEAWRAESQRRQAEVSRGLKEVLQRPVSCPPRAVVGDVLVPAAALDRLRHAGRDRHDPPGSSPGKLGR